jgi:hypothetical protein
MSERFRGCPKLRVAATFTMSQPPIRLKRGDVRPANLSRVTMALAAWGRQHEDAGQRVSF